MTPLAYRGPLRGLLWILLAYMLAIGAGCGLIYLNTADAPASSPSRTRPPTHPAR